MKIRAYEHQDYKAVVDLLNTCNVEPPQEPGDLGGICIVAEEDGKIIGCIWALVGKSTQAHIDYAAVDPEHRKSHVGWGLLKVMDETLKNMGVHRYTFYLETDNKYFTSLIEKYGEANGTTRLRDLHFFRRELV